VHHGTQGAMLLGKPEEKEMIINMGPWGGALWICSLQSINGIDIAAKGRVHMPSAPRGSNR